MRRGLLIAVTLISLVIAALIVITRAETQPCFSDEQLRSVLIDAHFYGIGQIAGICARRFPDLKKQIIDRMQKLEATYRTELSNLDRLSIEAFEHNYPGHGQEMRDKNANAVSEPSRKEAEGYTQEQCKSIMYALEGFAYAGWSGVTRFPLSFFEHERAQVPRC